MTTLTKQTQKNLTQDRENFVFVTNFVSTSENSATINGRRLMRNEKVTLGDKIKTNNSRVELRNEDGVVFRLLENSTFELSLTDNGIIPVLYGNIYKFRNYFTVDSGNCWKYITSCFAGCRTIVVVDNLSDTVDRFYCLGKELDIYEYDELGTMFNIVSIKEGEYCDLIHDDSKKMRERYSVNKIDKISIDEYNTITDRFLNPSAWI